MQHHEGYAPGWGSGALSLMGQRTAAQRAGFALPLLAGASRVVDVGCGPGSITVGLARAAPTAAVLGIDREPSQLDGARTAAAEAAVGNVTFEQGSVYALPAPDRSADVVFSHALFEHLADPARALAECARVLRVGGALAVCCSDWSRATLDPRDDDVAHSLEGHYLLRRRAGGDPFRGRDLPALVTHAGFSDVTVARSDHSDMAYPEMGDWIGSRLHAALAGTAELTSTDRAILRRAEQAAGRWAARPGRFVQCWTAVTARRAA